jgi:hypothetical protein
MNTFDHLDNEVSQDAGEHMERLMQGLDLSDFFGADLCACEKVEPIQGVPVPGFVPFQNGGFSASDLYLGETGLSPEHSRFIEEQRRAHEASFREDNGLSEDCCLRDNADFEEYEPDCLCKIELFAMKNGSFKLYVCLNYRGSPYYVEGDSALFEHTYLNEESLRAETVESLTARILKGVK